MANYVANVPIKAKSDTVSTSALTYLEVMNFPFPLSVTVIPGSGGTMKVEYSTTPNAAGLTTSANWITWPSGTVSATTSDTLVSPVTALRFTATTAAGTYEVVA